MSKTHSQFSASSAARLLTCPASFKIAADLDTGVRTSTTFAAEGTLAHAISEAAVFAGRKPADFVGQTRAADGYEFTVDEDFAEAVSVYVDFVQGLRALGYVVALENKVSPTLQWPDKDALGVDLFGTTDCVAYQPDTGHLVIADLKFGRGVAVEVVDNPQLLYYAAGAMDPDGLIRRMLGWTSPADQSRPVPLNAVQLVVIQPRAAHPLGPIRAKDYAPDEVREWARTALYDGVKTALADNGQTFKPSKHCFFCPAARNASCQALIQHTKDTARRAFLNEPIENVAAADPAQITAKVGTLTDAELADLRDEIEITRPLFDAVQRVAQERAEQGKTIKGWKLVAKRGVRAWADTDDKMLPQLDQFLPASGIAADSYSSRTLLSPAQVERKLGKKKYDQLVKPHVVKRSSGKTLAPEGDPRARIAGRTAVEAFGIKPKPPADPDDW